MGRCCAYNAAYTNAASYPYAGTNPVVPGNPNYASSYSCGCSTSYPQYLRVLQSAASTVSTITSWLIGATSLVKSLRVKNTGTQITAQVYSDTSLVTQIGSDLVYTATGATVTSDYGILIKPSTYAQGYTVGSVNITRNP